MSPPAAFQFGDRSARGALATAPTASCQLGPELVHNAALSLVELGFGVRKSDPFGTVDLGEGRCSSGTGRPFELDHAAVLIIGLNCFRVNVALDGEGMKLFLPSPEGVERGQIARGSRVPELFFELSERGVFGRLGVRIKLAFWDRPGVFVLLGPERPAGMNEQNLDD